MHECTGDGIDLTETKLPHSLATALVRLLVPEEEEVKRLEMKE